MLDKNRIEEIKKVAATRRNGILAERKKAEEEREKRIRKTEDALVVIGEAYQILAEGNEGEDRDISLRFRRLCGYDNVKIEIIGAPRRCRIAFRGDRYRGDFLVCSYYDDGTIDAAESARSISEGHVLKLNLGGASRDIAEWIVQYPDDFVTEILTNIEHRYHRYGDGCEG